MADYKLYHGDCLEVMQRLIDDGVPGTGWGPSEQDQETGELDQQDPGLV